MPKLSRGEFIFQIPVNIFISILILISVLPFVHIIAISLSASGPAGANLVGLVPVGFNIESYKAALADQKLIGAFTVSVVRVALGVVVNMTLTILVAFPLSRGDRRFPGRQVYVWFLIITMLFYGGLIPNYILIKRLNLFDSIWALILPASVPVFNVVVLLNFFRQVPVELEESAFMDGAGYFKILLRIFIPLSIPSIATLVLFCVIAHWNSWFDGLIYMRSPENYPLSSFLKIMITRLQQVQDLEDAERMLSISNRSLSMSYILITILPLLCIYPLIQKHIKTGLVLGSVKG